VAIVISNEGEALILSTAVGKTAQQNWKLRLFTNDITPAHDDVAADYTEVGAVQGYAAKTLTTSSWNAATAGTGVGTSAVNKAAITYAQQTYTADGTGGSQTVRGYFITDNAGTTLIGAERFASDQTWADSGDLIKVTPALTCGTE
jgi:hypothetical protein